MHQTQWGPERPLPPPVPLASQNRECVHHIVERRHGAFINADSFRCNSAVLNELFLHQRDQGRYDDCCTREQKRRDLVAQGFPGPGRHHAKHVPSGQQSFHQRLLSQPECMVPVYLFQGIIYRFVRYLDFTVHAVNLPDQAHALLSGKS